MAKEQIDPTEIRLQCVWQVCGKLYENQCRSEGEGVLQSLERVSSLLNHVKADIDCQIEVIKTKGETAWQKWMDEGVSPFED